MSWHHARIGQQFQGGIDANATDVDCRAQIETLESLVYNAHAFFGTYLSLRWGYGITPAMTNDEWNEYTTRLHRFERERNYCVLLGVPAGIICADRITSAWNEWFSSFYARVKERLIRECESRQAAQRAAEAERQRRIREGARSRVPGGIPTQPDFPGSPVGPVSQAPVQIRSPLLGPLSEQVTTLSRATGAGADFIRGYYPRW